MRITKYTEVDESRKKTDNTIPHPLKAHQALVLSFKSPVPPATKHPNKNVYEKLFTFTFGDRMWIDVHVLSHISSKKVDVDWGGDMW